MWQCSGLLNPREAQLAVSASGDLAGEFMAGWGYSDLKDPSDHLT